MSESERVSIPQHLGAASTLISMQIAAAELQSYDSPQALPMLAKLNARAPAWLRMLMRFILVTLWVTFSLFLTALIVAGGWYITLVVFQSTMMMYYDPTQQWMMVWIAIAGAITVWYVVKSKPLRKSLMLDENEEDGQDNPLLWRLLLAISKGIAYLLVVVTLFWGLANAIMLVLNGVMTLWPFVQELSVMPEAYDIAAQYGAPVRYVPIAIYAAIGLVVLILAVKAQRLLLAILWGAGAYGFVVSEQYLYMWSATEPLLANVESLLGTSFLNTLTQEMILIGMASLYVLMGLLLPLRIADWIAGKTTWPYRRWKREIIWQSQAWDLKRTLSGSFTYHRLRNEERVKGKGAQALCKEHLEHFVCQQAGPVKFWWCPICHDDDRPYCGVQIVRGMLDTTMNEYSEQHGAALHINVMSWGNDGEIPETPPLQEVYVGQLNDTHDIEVFMTQYHDLENERHWPSLSQIPCLLAADTNLDENGQRQVRSNFYSVTQA